MGLFSKKEYVCSKCGRTYVKRLNLNGDLCDECYSKEANERAALEDQVKGYVNYCSSVRKDSYSIEELKKIIEHKNNLVAKFKNPNGINRIELENASDNYKKLTDDQAQDILRRIAKSTVKSTIGAGYTEQFFVPTSYEGLIVDAKDIFAVGFGTDFKLHSGSDEVILCAVFTNDPYVPVFPMVYVGKTSFFELTKSKKGRANVSAIFESICPNLTYEVGDLKQLKKQIKNDGSVKGKLDSQFVLDKIEDALCSRGLFNTKDMYSNMYASSATMLDEMGYIYEEDIDEILKMDKMFNRNYWSKQIKNM